MNFAIKFFRGSKVMTKANEIIIKYNEKNANLLDFVQKWPDDKRIIVDITELENVHSSAEIFVEAAKLHKNIVILLHHEQSYCDIAEMNISFFFIEGVKCYDDLRNQIQLGVSDVYIMNELCFNMKKIAEYCHQNNVKVRVYPNVAQSASIFETDTFKKFFIRPDDVALYEGIVDVFEFFGPLEKQDVLFDIYWDERWLGLLDDVILGLNRGVDNRTIMPYFGMTRVDCNKRCNMGKCDICESIVKLGGTLEEKGIVLNRRKAKHENRVDEENMSNESAEPVSHNEEISGE